MGYGQLFYMRIIFLMDRYNCDDVHCYYDLARLRGLRYMTWQNLDKLTQEDEASYTDTNFFHVNAVYVCILCYQSKNFTLIYYILPATIKHTSPVTAFLL